MKNGRAPLGTRKARLRLLPGQRFAPPGAFHLRCSRCWPRRWAKRSAPLASWSVLRFQELSTCVQNSGRFHGAHRGRGTVPGAVSSFLSAGRRVAGRRVAGRPAAGRRNADRTAGRGGASGSGALGRIRRSAQSRRSCILRKARVPSPEPRMLCPPRCRRPDCRLPSRRRRGTADVRRPRCRFPKGVGSLPLFGCLLRPRAHCESLGLLCACVP